MRARQALLVLDNCEHLLAPAASVAFHLLRECAGLRILATSRETLGIIGELVWPVPGLAVPDLSARLPTGKATLVRVLTAYESVQLFAERARSVQHTFEVTGENATTIAQICARLEGIPLAIELAAPRVRVLTVEQINARLDNHLSLLTGGSQMAVPRHQTLRAALNWSYELLSEAERLLLARLSVFVGDWDLEAAESVCGGDEIESTRILDLLTSLVEKSVVTACKQSHDAKSRYRLLESVRQFASERLHASGGSEAARRRHLNFFLALAEAAEPQLRGAEQDIWLQRLQDDYGNLRAALTVLDRSETAGGEARLRLASAMRRFWIVHHEHCREGRRLVEAILQETNLQPITAARASAAFAAGMLAAADDDSDAAMRWYEESHSISEGLADALGAARALERISFAHFVRGDHVTAENLLIEVLPIFGEFGDKDGIARTKAGLAHILSQRSEYLASQACYAESVKLFEEVGDIRSTAWLLTYMGNNAGSLLEFEQAQNFYERSLSIFERVGDKRSMASVIQAQGVLASNRGDFAGAIPYMERSADMRRAMGERTNLAWSLANLGYAMKLSGETSSAKTTIEESLAIFEQVGDKRGTAGALSYLAEVESALEHLDTAAVCFLKSLMLFRDLQNRAATAMILSGLASIQLHREQAATAVKLFAAATSVRQQIGAPLPANEQQEFDAWVNQAARQLEAEAFEEAWRQGFAMTWEAAVDFALGLGQTI